MEGFMERVDGSITTATDEYQTEDMLLTYSEEEKQDNEINASNASLLFSPKFIPVYPDLLDRLTFAEALIFGFIDFYKSSSSARFYFTNEQIASIVKCNPDTVSRAITRLQELGLIKTSKRMRGGGGLIRFVTDIFYDRKPTNYQFGNRQIPQTNNNKINNNKIKENKREASLEYLENISLEEITKLSDTYKATKSQVREKAEALANYCRGHGKTYRDYGAMLKNALLRDFGKRDIVPKIVIDIPKPEKLISPEKYAEFLEKKKQLFGR